MGSPGLIELASIICAGVLAAFVAVRFKLPTLLGYLFAGILLSLVFPNTVGSELTQNIAQLGAALLLFTIGLEFSVQAIKDMWKLVVIGALVQALITIVLAVFILPLFGLDQYSSFVIGVIASTSSTAFVIKLLEIKSELQTRSGKIMLGWLLIQDVMVITWYLLLSTYAPNNKASPDLIGALLSSAIVIAVTYLIGKYILPPVLREIVRTKSDELLVVSVIGAIAAFAVFVNLFGVSFTIGAFLAGLALSENFLNHEIFSQVKPIRNLFMMIFFVSIGAIFNVNSVVNSVGIILLIVFGLLTLKAITIVVINIWFRVHLRDALKVGLGMFQIGEFAFLAAQLGLNSGWIDTSLYSILIASTILSMAITPFLYSNSDWVYAFLEKNLQRISPRIYRGLFLVPYEPEEIAEIKRGRHIVLCGYGRVGKYIAQALQQSHIPFTVIEINSNLVQEATAAGLKAIYGDADHKEILEQAGITTAKALIVALPGSADVNAIIIAAKEMNPEIKVIARAHGDVDLDLSNIDHPVEPEFEAAAVMISTLYRLMRRQRAEADDIIKKLR